MPLGCIFREVNYREYQPDPDEAQENIMNYDTPFIDITYHIHLYLNFGMDITGVVDIITGCVGSIYFGFHNDGSLFYHVVTVKEYQRLDQRMI